MGSKKKDMPTWEKVLLTVVFTFIILGLIVLAFMGTHKYVKYTAANVKKAPQELEQLAPLLMML